MKKIDAIFLIAIAMTAVVSISAVQASQAEPDMTEPKETVCQATTAPTAEETAAPTQEPTETEVTETAATQPSETEPPVILYDVPLDEELQLYIIGQAEMYEIDPAIIFAMIWRESGFKASAVGDKGNSLGLMQIQPRWNGKLMEQLDCPDLLDPFQNVTVGIHILAEKIVRHGGNVGMALMAYNAGDAGAYNNWFSKGIYSNNYSQAILQKAEELKVVTE